MSKFKTFDFKNCNFETIEGGADYFVSFLKDYNYIEFCKNNNFQEAAVYRIAVKKLADDVFVVADDTLDIESGEELPFQYCQLCRTIADVGKYVFDRMNRNFFINFNYGNINNEKDYFHNRYAYVKNM